MKFCPTCQARYDQENLLFCKVDGAPLVDESQPNFTALPSEDADEDFGEETLIRRNRPPLPAPVPDIEGEPAPRIIIPTSEPVREPVRASPQTYRAPARSNTGKVVAFTVLGTMAVLAGVLGLWWFLSGRNSSDTNSGRNVNTNPPNQNLTVNVYPSATMPPINGDSNLNSNFGSNFNTNFNSGVKTPTPTRSPSPSPSKSPTPANSNSSFNAIPGNTNTNGTRSPTPTPSPKASPSAPSNQNVNAGVLNGRAVSLTKPAYPPAARQANASGPVTVQVTLDEEGNVTSAKATSGHPLLRGPAEAAARQSKFNPVTKDNQPVRATGVVLYSFVNQ
jgi:TonB family protein